MGGISRKAAAAMAVAGLALLPLACSDDGDTSTGTDDSTPTTEQAAEATTTTEAAATGDDLAAFCAAFPQLGGDAQDQALTAEQWEARIANVEEIAAVAPAEVEAQAEAYVAMNEARAELAAENGYVAATELPADARQAFIGENRELQQQVNELIAYMQEHCG
jgi:hypothetical protein